MRPILQRQIKAVVQLLILCLMYAGSVHAIETEYGLLMTPDGLSCGSLKNSYGPYDYTNPTHVKEKLPIVEQYHFTTNVESLSSGNNSIEPGGDLDYTLRTFPNHHRALHSIIRYHLQTKSVRTAPDAGYPTECYLIRARAFSPGDVNVYVLYGFFLARTERLDDAIDQFEAAVSLNSNSAEAHYNLGLMYIEMGRLESAVEHAKIAYQLGYPLPGLKKKLKKAGAWSDEE